jgi:phosphopantothenoylcysteine decarboxylase/phosphopantothenate--cysteine ligase
MGASQSVDPRPHRVLVGVSGGIAAYKSAFLVSRLAQAGCDVHVAMTRAATRFVGPATFAALSSHPVAIGPIRPQQYPLGPHIALAQDAALMIIAPATADLMARCANGFAPCAVSTLYLQVTCPVLMAPAMSSAMWDKPAVQRNVQQLIADGVRMVGPGDGWQSCRNKGTGRMAEPEDLLAAAMQELAR